MALCAAAVTRGAGSHYLDLVSVARPAAVRIRRQRGSRTPGRPLPQSISPITAECVSPCSPPHCDLQASILEEFYDTASMKTPGYAGVGLFPVPTAIRRSSAGAVYCAILLQRAGLLTAQSSRSAPLCISICSWIRRSSRLRMIGSRFQRAGGNDGYDGI